MKVAFALEERTAIIKPVFEFTLNHERADRVEDLESMSWRCSEKETVTNCICQRSKKEHKERKGDFRM